MASTPRIGAQLAAPTKEISATCSSWNSNCDDSLKELKRPSETRHASFALQPESPVITEEYGETVSNGSSRSQRSLRRSATDSCKSSQKRHSSLDRMTELLHLKLRLRKPGSMFLYNILEDPESGRLAYWYTRATPFFIFATVVLTLCQTVSDPPISGILAAVLELTVDVVFTFEVALRYWACPSTAAFFCNIYNFIDILAATPLVLRSAAGLVLRDEHTTLEDIRHNIPAAILLGAVPVLRLLKVLRGFQQFHLLLRAFKISFEALPVMIFFYILLMLCLTVCIYVAEPAANIASLPQAMWLAFTSITTVGYGDFAPVSTMGRVFVAFFATLGMLYMSIPLGIIGTAFSTVWEDRDRILLTQKTRRRLMQLGYQADDIPKLFRLFDIDNDRELNFEEFKQMVEDMKLGLKEARVVELFNLFDRDQSGAVTDLELVKGLFPETVRRIYGSTRSSAAGTSSSRGLSVVSGIAHAGSTPTGPNVG